MISKKTTQIDEPEKIDREAIRAANEPTLRAARKLAADAFGAEKPTPEMVLGAADLLRNLGEEVGSAHLRSAISVAKSVSPGASPAEVFSVSEALLLDDDQIEEHLLEASREAERLFGAPVSAETAVDVYYELYVDPDLEG